MHARRHAAVWAAAFSLLAMATSTAASEGIAVQPRSGISMTVSPGGLFSTAVALASDDLSRTPRLREHLIVPEGWMIAAPVGLPFSLQAREEIRMIAVAVGRTATAGTYSVLYVVSAEDDPLRDYARFEFSIIVPKLSKVDIEPDGAADRLVAGDPVTARWRVVNRGNSPATFDLRARSTLDFSTRVTPSVLTLTGGESAVVSVEASTPKDLRREQSHSLLVEVRARENSGSSQTVAATAIIQPRFTVAAPDEREAEATVTTQTASRRTDTRSEFGAQVEVAGRTSVNGDLNQRLDFILRPAPVGHSSGVLGRDQYSLSYRSSQLDLLLGDQLFTLSPLTQRWLTGRGAEIEYREAVSKAGMYYATTPWAFRDTRQTAFYLESQVARGVALRGNLLLQDEPMSHLASDLHSVIPSLQLYLKPARNVTFEVEGALSDNNDDTRGEAYRAHLRGRWGDGVYYDLEHVQASPRYFGYYRDMELSTANLTWQVNREWQTHAAIQFTDTNPERDPSKNTARSFRSTRFGVDRRISPRLSLSIEGEAIDSVDHLPGGEPGLSEEVGTFAATWMTERLFVRAEAQLGQAHVAEPLHDDRSLGRYSLLAIARPRRTQTISLMLMEGDARYSVTPRRETSATVASEWNFLNGVRMHGAASVDRSRGTTTQTERSVELGIGYDFLSGSAIDLSVREALFSDHRRDESVLLSYKVRFRATSSKQKKYGSVEGVLESTEGGTSVPLPNAILHLDQLQAATDASGHFVFPLVKPGRYTVTVDPGSLGGGYVLEDQRPRVIEIAPKTRERLKIAAIRAARVEGQISIYEPATTDPRLDPSLQLDAMKRVQGLEAVTVELRREGMSSRRTLTDQNGRFAFYKVPPGDWKIVIDDHNTPPAHRLETGEFVVHLDPGGTGRVDARVLPIGRKMKMLDQRWLGVTSAMK